MKLSSKSMKIEKNECESNNSDANLQISLVLSLLNFTFVSLDHVCLI